MNNKNPNTEAILDAIRNMMSDNSVGHEQELPKDVIELTNPLNESVNSDNQTLDILELNNPISDKNEENMPLSNNSNSQDINNLVTDEQIKRTVRNVINRSFFKLAKNISDNYNLNYDAKKIDEISKSPDFQESIVDLLREKEF